MIWAIFKTMALRLFRDPGALLLALALPPLIYIIFAAIFTTATGGDLELRISAVDQAGTPASQSIIDALVENPKLTVSRNADWTESDLRQRVRVGLDDVAVMIVSDPALEGASAITLIEDPGRDVAAQLLMGKLNTALVGMAGDDVATFNRVKAMEPSPNSARMKDPSVAYYVGAVAMMFVLFSTLQSAAITLEERRSGITSRLLFGLRGAAMTTLGRFLFLVALGFTQVVAISAVAQYAFGVPVLDNLLAVAVCAAALAVFCAGFALFVASLSKSPSQLHAVSTFAVLVLSAIGGSMVPRFMMPGWLQDVAGLTPNGWVIDLFYGVLARGQTLLELWPLWCICFASGVSLTFIAAMISQRLGRV